MSEVVAKSSPRTLIIFFIAFALMVIAALAAATIISVHISEIGIAIVLIGTVFSFVGSVISSFVGLGLLLVQVRHEMNSRLDQLIQSKENMGFNAGMLESERGGKVRRG